MGQETGIAAVDIASAILEITGEALMSGDFDAFLGVFHVPQHMATMAGPIFMETEADMRRAFDQMHAHFSNTGVTDLVREVVAAQYISPTRISSTHVSEMIRNGQRLNDPYPVFSIIEKIDATWKVTGSEYALEANNGQALAIARADVTQRMSS
jgi:hypothetical protein